MSYLFAAYAVFWTFTFVFVFRLHARLAQLERQLEALQRALDREANEGA